MVAYKYLLVLVALIAVVSAGPIVLIVEVDSLANGILDAAANSSFPEINFYGRKKRAFTLGGSINANVGGVNPIDIIGPIFAAPDEGVSITTQI